MFQSLFSRIVDCDSVRRVWLVPRSSVTKMSEKF